MSVAIIWLKCVLSVLFIAVLRSASSCVVMAASPNAPALFRLRPTRRIDVTPTGLYGLTRIFLQMMIRLATRTSDAPDSSTTRTAYGFRHTGPILTEGEIEVYTMLVQRSSPAFGACSSWSPRMDREALIMSYLHTAWLQCTVPLALAAAIRDFRMTPFAFNTRDDTTLDGTDIIDRSCVWHEREGQVPPLNNRDPARLVQKLFLALLDVTVYELIVDSDFHDMREIFGNEFEEVSFDNYSRWIGSDPHPVIVFGQRWVPRTLIATPEARDRSVANSSEDGGEDDDGPGAAHAEIDNPDSDSDPEPMFILLVPDEADFSGDDAATTEGGEPATP
jgi:hypothetical protein